MNAADVLARVDERYRNARTYSDRIAYRNVRTRGDGERSVSTARARTLWVAPDWLLFELEDDPTEFFDGKRLALWTPAPGIVKSLFLGTVRDEDASIDSGLYRLQGVSHGLTWHVPRQLLVGRGIASADRFALTIDGEQFRLEAELDPEARVTLFVDQADYALRRVVTWDLIRPVITAKELEMVEADIRDAVAANASKPFESENTIDYTPTFDAPIDDAAFDLKVSSTPDPPAR